MGRLDSPTMSDGGDRGKRRDRAQSGRAARGCLIVLAIAITVTVAWHFVHTRFTSLGWRIFSRDRVSMTWDLLDRHVLDGLDVREVDDLLGKPDQTDYGVSTWYLGGTFLGYGFLHVGFDERGIVAEARFEDD